MEELGTSQSDDNLQQELRRYIRILVDIGRLVGEQADLSRLLSQVVVQIAPLWKYTTSKCSNTARARPIFLSWQGSVEGRGSR